ncbi:MAG TPA: SulP family inorganic anion transporter [Planctomycetaceae bacterium]|jgi:carbonic anhydrase/SulP family sulfate permease|nr:SulP family inorganic anion transporter [Planctomycetaceae bacterium]
MSQTQRPSLSPLSASTLRGDLTAGLVVFLAALPLCLGVASASSAPYFAGVLAGIVGGIVAGALSGSHTSVSGPSPGLSAIVLAQLAALGSFHIFLMAVVVAGLVQIALGVARAGFVAAFFPSSVIKGLLAAIGLLLILKQAPHMLGWDADPEGDMAFFQPDNENTFSELWKVAARIQPGAAAIGLVSLAILIAWENWKLLKKVPVPAPLVVVLFGAASNLFLQRVGGSWLIQSKHLVQVPVASSLGEFFGFLESPDFSQWANPAVYTAGLTIAAVASLETLLNLEAVDKIDPQQRRSPPSRELWVQGIGNVTCGLVGGLPISSAIVRSSVNVNAGSKTKLSTIVHGTLLLGCVLLIPSWLNVIPLSCLAAILLITGTKLARPALFKQMWSEGRYQFIPFALTMVAIIFTDLLVGVLIGLAVGLGFILMSNLRQPIRRFEEKHLGGDVLHIALANQVSFLNRAALIKVFDDVPPGRHVLLDAVDTDYIDPDILDLIRDFREKTAPARGVEVSVVGFREQYQIADQVQYVDYSTRELQSQVTPQQVVEILKNGNERFRSGRRLTRDLVGQVRATAAGQHPLAVVLSCIDSRSPAELIFDLGLGDVFVVRIAGNVVSAYVLGSMEYACAVAGAKLILVLGHTRCGAVTTAVKTAGLTEPLDQVTGCQHIEPILRDIQTAIDSNAIRNYDQLPMPEQNAVVDKVARANVLHTVAMIGQQSQTLSALVAEGRILIVGAMYDVASGAIDILSDTQ